MEIHNNREPDFKPLVSAYTIIGRNVRLLDQWIQCVKSRSGMKPFEYEIDLVLWDPADDILQYVNDNKIRYTIYDSSKHEYSGHPDHRFVFDLYRSWNMGYAMSRASYVFRSGSDQIMSKDFLSKSMDLILDYEYELTDDGFKPREQDRTAFYHLLTLESWEGSKAAYGRPCSRHIMPIGMWNNLYNPDWERFDKFCEAILVPMLLSNEEYALPFNHATRGWIFHTVGASWIQRKETWDKIGPLWEHLGPNALTGDVEYFDRGESFGIPSFLIADAATLHRCKAEASW